MTERMVPRSHARDIAEACSELADKALSWKDRALATEEALRKFAAEVYSTTPSQGLDAATVERKALKRYADMAAALRNTPANALREAGYLDRAADMLDYFAGAATVERFRDAIVTIIGRCEALEDEAADELAKEQPDHAAGFYRGQKITAKSLRRHLADLSRPITLAADPHQHGAGNGEKHGG